MASISLSLGVSHVQAQAENAKHWRELEARYVRSVGHNAVPLHLIMIKGAFALVAAAILSIIAYCVNYQRAEATATH